MRTINLFLASLLFIPFISNAQDREFDDTIMVFGTSNGQGYENLAEGCAWAEPYVSSGIALGMTFDLQPAMINGDDGLLTLADGTKTSATGTGTKPFNEIFNEPPEKFGELWVCAGPMEDADEDGWPERIVAYVIIMGDDVYGALGKLRPETNLHFPQEGMAVWSGGAGVEVIVDDQPAGVVGALSANVLENRMGTEGYVDGFLITLRLYEARNLELEAAAEALQ